VVRVTECADSPEIRRVAEELEDAGAQVEVGGHSRRIVRDAHLMVVSPGVPPSAPVVRWAKRDGIPVVGELELGSWYCSGHTMAVTGTNGKSTVVTLLGEILRSAGRPTVVCGNIGTPLCSVLDQIHPNSWVVLEVSSFQLEFSLSFHTWVAALLNISENHLDRHGFFDRYRATKAKLFAHQSSYSWAILNRDDIGLRGMERFVRGRMLGFSRKAPGIGAYAWEGQIWLNLYGRAEPLCRVEEMVRKAPHDQENALAAACMAGVAGVSKETIAEVLKRFKGLPHRQQSVAEVNGVTFINDSKSTTVAAGLRAIESAPGPVVLIAGGRDKGSDFRPLRRHKDKIKAAVVMGEDGYKIAASLKGLVPLHHAAGLPQAVQTAFRLAKAGECVLFSPMCTSFDMFRNFEERGRCFVELVHTMIP